MNTKILVVDDDNIILNATSRMLEAAGYQVFIAANGQEALVQAFANRPDLILLDVDMPPGIDGFEVCKQIKSDPRQVDTCIIFISGARADIESKLDGFGIGADDYIVRPVSMRELLARVQAMLRIYTAEKALKISIAQWCSAFDAVHEAIILTDLNFTILRCNRSAAQFFLPAAQDMLGKQCQAVLLNGQAELQQVAAELFSAHSQPESLVFLRETRWLEVSRDLAPGLNGDLDGYTFVIADVTKRKQAEAKLRDYNLRLENSNRDLTDFAYIASHDLQEPIHKVLAFSDLLDKKYQSLLDDSGRDYLARIQAAARHMQTLIHDLFAISRISTQPQNFSSTDLSEIVAQVISDMAIFIEKNAGQVQVVPLPTIAADSTQMYQLFQNLIGNALKFHAQGRPPLIKIFAQDAADDFCRISVADNGIGFDIQALDRIFKPFQRLVDRSSYEGSGMGLAICRRIVERHHGCITATSIPNQGSTFIISLPLRQTLTGTSESEPG